MTTSKSPEQIMEEFEEKIYPFKTKIKILIKGSDKFIPSYQTESDIRDFLRSSMAGLLCYMAERMPEETGCELCSLNDGETHSCMIGPLARERNNAINDCRTLLIEEARKVIE